MSDLKPEFESWAFEQTKRIVEKEAEVVMLRKALKEARSWITNHHMRKKIDAALNGNDA